MVFAPKKYQKILKAKYFHQFSSENLYFPSIDELLLREEFRKTISWHIPTQSLMTLLGKYSPIISIGAGRAYTEYLANKIEADVIASDIAHNYKNKWHRCKKPYMKVEQLTAIQAIKKYRNRNVFMAWPPYSNKMAYQVVRDMKKGKYLIYIGESQSGCTGDNDFFDFIDDNFKEIKSKATIPSWFGIYDKVFVFKKL